MKEQAIHLSFSFVTTYQMNKVDEITKTQGEEAGAHYLDSVMNNPVWLGAYSLKDRKSTRLNSSHITRSRMPSSA